MKILHISFSDSRGGASIAGYNIYNSQKLNGMKVKFLCFEKFTNDDDVIEFNQNFFQKKIRNYKQSIDRRIIKFFLNDKKNSYSTGFFGSNLSKYINDFDCDIVNLHWINNSMMSIKDISQIKKKIVWTLHDMWPFCGAEHFSYSSHYMDGYSDLSEFDINKFIWKKKKNFLSNKINFISPSEWMHTCAKSSIILKNMNSKKIPYPINFDTWKINDQIIAKKKIGLNDNKEKVVIFGSERGSKIDRKNFTFLFKILKRISKKIRIRLLVFGENKNNYEIGNLAINYLGHIYNKEFLNYVYSSGDVLAMPSKLETFGLIGIESILSGTPCVAFSNTGLEEIIIHRANGYLSKYLDESDYENGLKLFLNTKDKVDLKNDREELKKKFDNKKIYLEYLNFYESLLIN
jgi:glycosyltransferase involved in cell wall biosynthesis